MKTTNNYYYYYYYLYFCIFIINMFNPLLTSILVNNDEQCNDEQCAMMKDMMNISRLPRPIISMLQVIPGRQSATLIVNNE